MPDTPPKPPPLPDDPTWGVFDMMMREIEFDGRMANVEQMNRQFVVVRGVHMSPREFMAKYHKEEK